MEINSENIPDIIKNIFTNKNYLIWAINGDIKENVYFGKDKLKEEHSIYSKKLSAIQEYIFRNREISIIGTEIFSVDFYLFTTSDLECPFAWIFRYNDSTFPSIHIKIRFGEWKIVEKLHPRVYQIYKNSSKIL